MLTCSRANRDFSDHFSTILMDLGDQILDLPGFINFPRQLILAYIDPLLGEHSVQIQSLRPDHFEDAKRLQADAWGEQLPQLSREQFETRIGKFPEGNICAVKDGRMLALINTQRMNYDFDRPVPTWNEA